MNNKLNYLYTCWDNQTNQESLRINNKYNGSLLCPSISLCEYINDIIRIITVGAKGIYVLRSSIKREARRLQKNAEGYGEFISSIF